MACNINEETYNKWRTAWIVKNHFIVFMLFPIAKYAKLCLFFKKVRAPLKAPDQELLPRPLLMGAPPLDPMCGQAQPVLTKIHGYVAALLLYHITCHNQSADQVELFCVLITGPRTSYQYLNLEHLKSGSGQFLKTNRTGPDQKSAGSRTWFPVGSQFGGCKFSS